MKFDTDKIMNRLTVVHCNDLVKATSIVDFFKAEDISIRIIPINCYRQFSSELCINILKDEYGSFQYYKERGFKILEYEDVVIEEEKILPRKMLVWDYTEGFKKERIVLFIYKNGKCVAENTRSEGCLTVWDYCEEIPEAPKTREMNHVEMFKFLRDGGVIKSESGNVMNFWSTSYKACAHKICANYTGTDSDVWTKAEVPIG